jgi:hypothetical protein
VYHEACDSLEADGTVAPGTDFPPYWWRKAGASRMSKAERAQRMLAKGYETGSVVHVLGTHDVPERALRRFPLKKPFDLVDAAYWSWDQLANHSSLAALVEPARVVRSLGLGPTRRTGPLSTADEQREYEWEQAVGIPAVQGSSPANRRRGGMHSGAEHHDYFMRMALEGDDDD